MEVKIKSMKHEDFKDNEYIDNLVEQLRAGGTNIIVGKLDQLMNWGVSNSLWPLCFGTSCCAIEFMCLGAARYDMARYGFEVARNSPRQADYIMCQGTINYRMAPALKRLYEQMAEPKYVIACGSCTVSGGRRVPARLPAPSRGLLLCPDAAAAQDQGAEVLWRREPQGETGPQV